jgi:hypothetical protein
MNPIEKYEFDRQGYLVIPGMLTPEEVASLSAAMDRLEEHALAHVHQPPRRVCLWGHNVHYNPEKNYYAHGSGERGSTLIVEDFFNTDPTFDFLVNHAKTMEYIHGIVQGPVRINNSELRVRYSGNATGLHMGGPINHKYRYSFNGSGIDCMMVRMIYFVQDVDNHQGAFSVIPGTHKTNYPSPYRCAPDDEPGLIGLPVKTGDAILFTENLRHGGLTNRSEQVRKTLHVGYGPVWMMSQNMATMDEPQNISPEALARYDEEQKKLFVLRPQD